MILDTEFILGYGSLLWIRLDTFHLIDDPFVVVFWIRTFYGYLGYVWIRLDTFGYVRICIWHMYFEYGPSISCAQTWLPSLKI
jgi:hypothetical protein